MNSLGLGRHVNTLGLGLPYAGEVQPTGKSNDRYGEGYLTIQRRIKEEDEEIALFLNALLTKGLI